jgi:stage IV sporulation protein FB
MFERGYLPLGAWQGVPIRAHWSTPIACLIFSGFTFRPVMWFAILTLILFHELGHAFVVKRAGGKVLSADLTAFGGVCRWEGEVSAVGRAAIAWGGVWAQLLVYFVTVATLFFWGYPSNPATGLLVAVYTSSNLWMMLFNLIPIPPLDGAEAWKLFPALFRRTKKRAEKREHERVREIAQANRSELRRRDAVEGELENADPDSAEAARRVAAQLLEEAKRGSDAE